MNWLPWLRNQERSTSRIHESSQRWITSALPEKVEEEESSWLEGRHHNSGLPYLLPDDIHEFNRLDFQHYLMRYAMQSNYMAPVAEPRGILDVGCGTGRWAREMASLYSRAKVFGLDANADYDSPLMNTAVPNYRFIKGNILEGLPFPDMTFDFVHQRFLHAAIPIMKWQYVLEEQRRVMRRGAWIELVETDQIIHNPGAATQQLSSWAIAWGRLHGIDARVCSRLSTLLQSIGLTNIQKHRIDLPLGDWGGRIGHMSAKNMHSYNRAIKAKLVFQLGIDPGDYDKATQAMQQEWEEKQSYFSIYITCAQRLD